MAARLERLLDIDSAGLAEESRSADPSARETAIAAGLAAALLDSDGEPRGGAPAATSGPHAGESVPARPGLSRAPARSTTPTNPALSANAAPVGDADPSGDAEPPGEARDAAIAAALSAELFGSAPEAEPRRETLRQPSHRRPRRQTRPIAASVAPILSEAARAAVSTRASIARIGGGVPRTSDMAARLPKLSVNLPRASDMAARLPQLSIRLPHFSDVAGRLPKIGRHLPRLSGIRRIRAARPLELAPRRPGAAIAGPAQHPDTISSASFGAAMADSSEEADVLRVDGERNLVPVVDTPPAHPATGPAAEAIPFAGPGIDDVTLPVAAPPAIAAVRPADVDLRATAVTPTAPAGHRRRAIARPAVRAMAPGLQLTAAPGARPAAGRFWLVAASLGAGVLIATGVVAMALNGGSGQVAEGGTSPVLLGDHADGAGTGTVEAAAAEASTSEAPPRTAAAARPARPVPEIGEARAGVSGATPASARRIALTSSGSMSEGAGAAQQGASPSASSPATATAAATAADADDPDDRTQVAVVSSRFADFGQRSTSRGQRQAALGTIGGGRLGMTAPGLVAGAAPTASTEEAEADAATLDPADAVPTPASMIRPYFPETPPVQLPHTQPSEAPKSAAKSSGKIVRAVNMRSRPANGSQTVTVIPGGSSVGVISCRHWCQVEYDGRRGYVYKTFLQR